MGFTLAKAIESGRAFASKTSSGQQEGSEVSGDSDTSVRRVRQQFECGPGYLARRVSAHDISGKFCKIFGFFGGTGVMRSHAQMFGREAKSQSGVEFLDRVHLPIKPGIRIRPE